MSQRDATKNPRRELPKTVPLQRDPTPVIVIRVLWSGLSRGCLMANTPETILLLHGIAKNDQEAWRKFAERFRPFLVFCCYKCGHVGDEVEDIIQETLIKVMTGHATYEGRDQARFRTWLFRVCSHENSNWDRRNCRDPIRGAGGTAPMEWLMSVVDSSSSNEANERLDRELVQHAMRLALANFKEKTQDIFRDLWADLTPEEIVAKRGCTAQAVYTAKSRCNAAIREQYLVLCGEAPDEKP